VNGSARILVAADGAWVRDQVRNALAGRDLDVLEVTRGADVRETVRTQRPDLVILDMEIANMGGIAVAIDLHLEASADRVPDVPILLLLDREHDRFLAKRAAADAELVKPVDAATLRRTVTRMLRERAPA
jgi:DNA-binding response OmpR family regulator